MYSFLEPSNTDSGVLFTMIYQNFRIAFSILTTAAESFLRFCKVQRLRGKLLFLLS